MEKIMVKYKRHILDYMKPGKEYTMNDIRKGLNIKAAILLPVVLSMLDKEIEYTYLSLNGDSRFKKIVDLK